jgi:ATP-dependent Clp protease ATP-binding subunit ClpA
MLGELTDRIESTGVFIDFDSGIIPFLTQKARSDQFGARQLRREITRLIESPYSDAVVRGQIKSGDLVFCRTDGDRAIFDKKKGV